VAEEEQEMTEITIYPDGRVFVFGMSVSVLEILNHLQPHDERLRRLVEQSRQVNQQVVSASEE
jgi:hypothetical protein